MGDKNQDRRVQKTIGLLRQALVELIAGRGYESITVQDILDRANVGRSTFYAHFKDKDDLLLKAFDGLRKELKAANAPGMDFPGGPLISFSAAMFAHAYSHRKIYEATAGGNTGSFIGHQVEKIIYETISGRMEGERKRLSLAAKQMPDELLIHHLASSMMSVIKWWLDRWAAITPEKMDERYLNLVRPSLERAFGK